MDTYSLTGLFAPGSLRNPLNTAVPSGTVLVGSTPVSSNERIDTFSATTEQLVAALSTFAEAFRLLNTQLAPLYGTSIEATRPTMATVTGATARLDPLRDTYSYLQTTTGINTQTTTAQASSADLQLDLSDNAASRLHSYSDLGLDLSSPEAYSYVHSASAIGLDLSSPSAASRLQSSLGLSLDVDSAEAASRLSSSALGLDLSSPDAASKLRSAHTLELDVTTPEAASMLMSRATLDLDTISAQRVSTISSTAAIGSAPTSAVDPNARFNDADPNLRPRFDDGRQVGAGSFTINGTSIAVQADDSINSVLDRITASAAGVTASLDDDRITIRSKGNSEDAIVLATDTSGFLDAAKLGGATTTIGNIRDDQQLLARTTQFAAVASGTFSINGVSVEVDRDTDTLGSVIGKINGSAAGVTASYDQTQKRLVLTTSANSEDLITAVDGDSGFLAAAKLSDYGTRVESLSGLGLDTTSAQRSTTLTSTGEANTATTSYGSTTLNFSGSGPASTSTARLTGAYTGQNTAAAATSLTVRLQRDVFAMNSLTASSTRFDVVDQTGATVFAFDGQLKAGEKVYLGDDIGLSLSFTAGMLKNSQTASTTVSNNTRVDVDADASFNNADPALRPRFDNNAQVGAGSFKINGTTIAVNANDSINSVLARINGSAAGVTARFADDRLTIASNDFSEDDLVVSGDTSGFLAALKLSGATAVRGNVSDDEQTLASTSRFAAVTSGSFVINGSSITVDRNTDSLNSIIGKINASAAGVTASFDTAQNRVVITSNNSEAGLIGFGADSSGFLGAARLSAPDNRSRGKVRDDLQVLAKTTQFAGVGSGSFSINGVEISVDKDVDSLSTLAQRITRSAAGVNAVYDETLDKLVLSGKTASMDLIEVGGDNTGFLEAAALQTVDTERGQLREDTVALRKLSRFASVSDGSFVVDGKTIELTTGDSIQSIVGKINASGARVSAAFDAQNNRLQLTTIDNSEDLIEIGGDSSGFLAAAGINSANTGRGNVRDDRQALSRTTQFAGVGSGSFSINGVTISVDKDVDSLETLAQRISSSAAGVDAAYDASLDKLVLSSKAASMDQIEVGDDDTGFLAAAQLQTGNTVRGQLKEDEVALANLAQFATVSNGSFVVDGRSLSVDVSTDTVQTLLDKINNSGARVIASYDAQSDRITLQSSVYSEKEIPLGADSSGFLAAVGLDRAATVKGIQRDDRQLLTTTAAFGSVVDGSFEINSRTVVVNTAADSLSSVIDKINAAGAGVTASLNAQTNRIELVSHDASEDLIEVGNDSSGFLAAADLDAGNTLRGNLADDKQVFAKTIQFAEVRSGSFKLNGTRIVVDSATDSLQTVIARINGSGTGVTAGYDTATGRLVIAPGSEESPLVLENDSSGLLAAAGIATGAYGLRIDTNAAFNGTGLASPFFDPGQQVSAGSFNINGVDITVDADDSVDKVLQRITASEAGVSASFDKSTQTVKLTDRLGRSTAISFGDDTSGFLAAVKLDETASNSYGSGTLSRFDAALGKLEEYEGVRSGVLTLNGQDIAIDPGTSSVRGLVSAMNMVKGVQATLDERTGRIVLMGRGEADSISLADSSGVLAALGLQSGSFHGRPGSWKPVETRIGTTKVSNASDVAGKLTQAAARTNQVLASLAGTPAGAKLGVQVEGRLRAAVGAIAESGMRGIELEKSGRGLRLKFDSTEFATAMKDLGDSQAELGTRAGAVIDKLGKEIAALAAPSVADSPPPEREGVRDRLTSTFRPNPMNEAWKLNLIKTLEPSREPRKSGARQRDDRLQRYADLGSPKKPSTGFTADGKTSPVAPGLRGLSVERAGERPPAAGVGWGGTSWPVGLFRTPDSSR